MALKGRTSRVFLLITFLVLDISFVSQLNFFHLPAGMARGRSVPVASNSQAIVQSVYVEDILDLEVVQQPQDDANYVSPNAGELTQFGDISRYGNIGLLAHNYLEGRAFSRLAAGQEVRVLYSDGKAEYFVITEILRYQALQPRSPYSSFQNINDAEEVLSVGQMVDRVYKGEHHLTFQTCISRYGNSSWGRLFVLAMPKAEFEVESLSQQTDVGKLLWGLVKR